MIARVQGDSELARAALLCGSVARGWTRVAQAPRNAVVGATLRDLDVCGVNVQYNNGAIVICGTGFNERAWQLLRPMIARSRERVDALSRVFDAPIAEGGIPPHEVQYINYHGTSTESNDRIETRAVKLAFDGHAYKLAGSSLKSLIGHPQGACGAAGVAATLLAMRDGLAPPTINVDAPDPECDLDYISGVGRPMQIEYAVANCIAFGSKNSALLLRKI